MKNLDIREEIKSAGLFFWQVADGLHTTDSSFSRKLRHELSDAEKTRIRQIIAELIASGEAV